VPRKRQIKPSLFSNEELGAETTDPLIMLLFVALLLLADREGRLEDRPQKIVNFFAFPYRTIENPDEMLEWLWKHGFIVRYWVRGKRYIQIVNFVQHQTGGGIHPKEAASVIPPIPTDKKGDNLGSPQLQPLGTTKAHLSRALPSFPSFPSFPSLEEGAAIAAVDTAPDVDTAQQSDPVHRRIWVDGKELLMFSGMSADQAGPLLGRWAKEHGRIRLAEAIAATQAYNPPDPKDYIGGVLRRMKNSNSDLMVGKGREPTPEEEAAELEKYTCLECFDYGTVLIHSNDVDSVGGMASVPCECGQPARSIL
jgi:hypothetical protein